MAKLVLQRLLAAIPLLIIATAATFFLLQLSDADPAVIRLGENRQRRAAGPSCAKSSGVDRPAIVQYVSWLGDAIRLDFGQSWQRPQEVRGMVSQQIPATLSLTLGAVNRRRRHRRADGHRRRYTRRRYHRHDHHEPGVGGSGGAQLLGRVAAGRLRGPSPYSVFPATGFVGPTESIPDWIRSITLPAIALGTAGSASIARQTRAAVASTIQEPFVRTAVAAGHSRRSVLRRDVVRNAAIPVVTVIGIQASFLLGGSFIVEKAFALPGLGTLALRSILVQDVPVVLAIVAFAAVMITIIQLALDVLYGVLDPRVRVT